MKTIQFNTRDSWGNLLVHRFDNVSHWIDETSPYDPYTLRVIYSPEGYKMGAPIVGEFTNWQETLSTMLPNAQKA